MITYLVLVCVGFIIAAVIGEAQVEAKDEQQRIDAVRRLDHLRF